MTKASQARGRQRASFRSQLMRCGWVEGDALKAEVQRLMEAWEQGHPYTVGAPPAQHVGSVQPKESQEVVLGQGESAPSQATVDQQRPPKRLRAKAPPLRAHDDGTEAKQSPSRDVPEETGAAMETEQLHYSPSRDASESLPGAVLRSKLRQLSTGAEAKLFLWFERFHFLALTTPAGAGESPQCGVRLAALDALVTRPAVAEPGGAPAKVAELGAVVTREATTHVTSTPVTTCKVGDVSDCGTPTPDCVPGECTPTAAAALTLTEHALPAVVQGTSAKQASPGSSGQAVRISCTLRQYTKMQDFPGVGARFSCCPAGHGLQEVLVDDETGGCARCGWSGWLIPDTYALPDAARVYTLERPFHRACVWWCATCSYIACDDCLWQSVWFMVLESGYLDKQLLRRLCVHSGTWLEPPRSIL